MADKAQSLGLTLISPLALPDSDPRNPNYKKPDDDDQDGSGSDGGDWLRLEQPAWPEKPDGDFAGWLQEQGKGMSIATLQEYWSQYKSWCGDDGALEVPIRVHKSREDLSYSLKATYGTLSSSPARETTEHVESRTVDNAKDLDLEANIKGKVKAEWEGPVFGKDGGQLTKTPDPTADGGKVDFGTDIGKGTLRLTYSEEHDAYTLTIPPREMENTDQQNRASAYESTVYASWGDGQVERLDVDLPDMTGTCAEGGLSGVDGDGDGEGCIRHVVLVDPCTKKVIREWDEQIACPEENS